MSAVDTHIPNRRFAARSTADGRKKLILVGLIALLAGVLAFQLPKLLKSSGSSSSTASPSVTTPATITPATADQAPTVTATSAPAERLLAIRQMTPHDPFVPVIGDSAPGSATSSSSAAAPTSTSASAPASTSASAPASTSASAPASTSASAPASASASTSVSTSASQPASPTASTVVPTASAPSSPAAGQPAVASPAAPTAAVIWTNGKRQVVGLGHTFDVGDATFELAALDGSAMRLQVADGSFTGGKRTIAIRKGREVTLENNATGVIYTLRFAGGTSNGS